MSSEFVNSYFMNTSLDRLNDEINFLNDLGIKPKRIYRNLSTAELVEFSIKMNEGILSNTGSLVVETGKFTGRSPDDKFIVDDKLTHDVVSWGKINRPISEKNFDSIYLRMKDSCENKTVFIFDGYVGADEDNRIPIRVITDKAWHCLFSTQIFIRPLSDDLKNHKPVYTLLSLTDFRGRSESDGTRSETFIILNFSKGMILIGSTSYAGEIKKAFFSIMNFIFPKKEIFPMHCSANMTDSSVPAGEPRRFSSRREKIGCEERGTAGVGFIGRQADSGLELIAWVGTRLSSCAGLRVVARC